MTNIYKSESCDTSQYFVFCEKFQTCIFLEPWERRRQRLYAKIQEPILQVPAGEKVGLRGLLNLLKEEQKEEDEEENKDADGEEEEMEGKRRDEEDMQVSLLLLQLMLQDSFHPEEVTQPNLRDTQRPNIKKLCGAS